MGLWSNSDAAALSKLITDMSETKKAIYLIFFVKMTTNHLKIKDSGRWELISTLPIWVTYLGCQVCVCVNIFNTGIYG